MGVRAPEGWGREGVSLCGRQRGRPATHATAPHEESCSGGGGTDCGISAACATMTADPRAARPSPSLNKHAADWAQWRGAPPCPPLCGSQLSGLSGPPIPTPCDLGLRSLSGPWHQPPFAPATHQVANRWGVRWPHPPGTHASPAGMSRGRARRQRLNPARAARPLPVLRLTPLLAHRPPP